MDIPGFDIPALELTEDQKCEPITLARIREFHYEVGEDFLDQCEIGKGEAFAEILRVNRPHLSDEIDSRMKLYSSPDIHGFGELLENNEIYYDDVEDLDPIYHDYVDYCNEYPDVRAEVNVILYSVADYYK